jgi:hypothetical protein
VDLLEPLVGDDDAAAELIYWPGRAGIAKGTIGVSPVSCPMMRTSPTVFQSNREGGSLPHFEVICGLESKDAIAMGHE